MILMNSKRICSILLGLILFFTLALRPLMAAEKTDMGTVAPEMKLKSPRHNDLIKELVQQHRFDTNFLIPLFQDAVILPEILEKFNRAPERRLEYYEYRELFFKGELIEKGRSYMQENRALLEKVSARFGVPKEIIVAILGIETRFGEPDIEKYRAWDILNTAYILHPTRTDFYKGELIAYLNLCREEGLDPRAIKSSYAGAVGVPQFIPTSVLKYAVDFDGDGKRNLWSSKEDIYASVANYIKETGWKTGGLIRLPLNRSDNPEGIKTWVDAGIGKTLPVARAIEMGITLPASVAPTEQVALAAYKSQADQEQVLALFDNFRTIMRYNISFNYALVVTDLSEALVLPKTDLPPVEPPAASVTATTTATPMEPITPLTTPSPADLPATSSTPTTQP